MNNCVSCMAVIKEGKSLCQICDLWDSGGRTEMVNRLVRIAIAECDLERRNGLTPDERRSS